MAAVIEAVPGGRAHAATAAPNRESMLRRMDHSNRDRIWWRSRLRGPAWVLTLAVLAAGCNDRSAPTESAVAPAKTATAASKGSGARAAGTSVYEPGPLLPKPTTVDPDGIPIILIVVDTLRRDHLGGYGYHRATSPQLDRLAATSHKFENAFSQAPWTTPSVGALMTGHYPTTLGIKNLASTVASSFILLAEALRAAGYATGAAVSHTFCSATWGFAQGFDEFDESNILGHFEISSAGVSDRGIEFIDRHLDEKFFLWLHYFDPHFAYIEHEAHPFREGPDYEGPIASSMRFQRLLALRSQLGEPDWAEVRRLYDSEVAFTDEQIGRLLDHLRSRALFDRSLIIFTADHGEEFLDHDDLGHTKTLYQELVSVPLLIKLPNGRGAVVDAPVALIDLYPTLLDLLHIEIPADLPGHSLFREWKDPRGLPRPIFAETSRKRELRAIVSGPYKLIHDLSTDEKQLYDYLQDPKEQTDLVGSQRELSQRLSERLQHWTETLQRGRSPDTQISPAQTEMLRQLGYVADSPPGDSKNADAD